MDAVVVIRLGRLGDVALTGSTTKNLRFLYPRSNILFVTRAMYQPLSQMLPGVDEVITFPDNGSYFDLVNLSSAINEHSPDLMVDLHKNFRSFHLSALATAPYKVVYHKRRKERQAAVNDRKFVNPIPHTVDLYNGIIDQLKGEKLARRPDLLLPDEVLSQTSPREGAAIVPGASASVKAWPADRFARVTERIIYDFKIPVHVFLGAEEADLQEQFGHLPQEFLTFHHNRPIPEIAATLSTCRLTLTNDSGLMHVSSSVGTPTAALFGPTHEQLGFSPRGLHDVVIEVDEECRPCSLHGSKACRRDEQYCFTRLSVDMVYKQVAGMIDRIKLDPAVFIDRDGTLIVDKHYLADPQKLEFLPNSLDAVVRLKRAGYKIVVISNQSGVARAFFSVEAVDAVHEELRRQMREHDADPDDIRFCPHLPDGDDPEYTGDCDCRKPKGGMLEAAACTLGIDIKRSFIIGDKYSDLQAGLAAGTRSLLVRTGKGSEAENEIPANRYLRPYYIGDDLADAVDYIMNER